MNNTKIFYKECKYCGKKFSALYERQATLQRDVHELTCKEKKNDKRKTTK